MEEKTVVELEVKSEVEVAPAQVTPTETKQPDPVTTTGSTFLSGFLRKLEDPSIHTVMLLYVDGKNKCQCPLKRTKSTHPKLTRRHTQKVE